VEDEHPFHQICSGMHQDRGQKGSGAHPDDAEQHSRDCEVEEIARAKPGPDVSTGVANQVACREHSGRQDEYRYPCQDRMLSFRRAASDENYQERPGQHSPEDRLLPHRACIEDRKKADW